MGGLKAYAVTEPSEGNSVVVFATNGAEARRRGAVELEVDFADVESCKRLPWADHHAAAGFVTPLELIAAGWWFQCSHCERRIAAYVERDDSDDDGHPLEPVADGRRRVFCNVAHRQAAWAEQRQRDRDAVAVIEAALTQFHGLPISNVHARWFCTAGGRDTEATAVFDFPGRKGMPARWAVGGKDVLVSQYDEAAWSAMCDAAKQWSVK